MIQYALRFIFTTCCLLTSLVIPLSGQGSFSTGESDQKDLDRLFISAIQARLVGDADEAIEMYERILEDDSDNSAAAYELSRIFEAKEESGKALMYARQAVEKDPDNPWYHTFLAQVLESAGKAIEAAEIYEELHKQYPDNDYYLMMEAYLLVVGQKPEEAISIYDRLEEQSGVVPDISNKKVRLYLGLGKPDKAAAELRSLADAYPSHLEYQHELAELFVRLDRRQDALKVYERILTIDPSDPKARLAVGGGPELPREGSAEDKLLALFRDKDVPVDLKIQQVLPLIEQAAQSHAPMAGAERLMDLCRTIRDVHPSEAKSHALYGDVLSLTGQTEEAAEAYRTALQTDKSVYSVWEQLMIILLEQKQYAELYTLSGESLDLFPNQALSYFLNGLSALRKESYAEAIGTLQQAAFMSTRMEGLHMDILNSLGEAQFLAGQPDRGAQTFEKAISLQPQSVAVLSNYCVRLIESGQPEKALPILKRAEDINPSHPGIVVARGVLAYRQGDPKSAKSWLENALNMGVTDAFVLERLGDAALGAGDENEAVRYWQLALEGSGNTERLTSKIQTRSTSN